MTIAMEPSKKSSTKQQQPQKISIARPCTAAGIAHWMLWCKDQKGKQWLPPEAAQGQVTQHKSSQKQGEEEGKEAVLPLL